MMDDGASITMYASHFGGPVVGFPGMGLSTSITPSETQLGDETHLRGVEFNANDSIHLDRLYFARAKRPKLGSKVRLVGMGVARVVEVNTVTHSVTIKRGRKLITMSWGELELVRWSSKQRESCALLSISSPSCVFVKRL